MELAESSVLKPLLGHGYQKTEVGIIPLDWRITRLKDCLLGHPTYGINAAAVKYSSNLPTYLRITDISDDGEYIKEGKVSVNSHFSDNYELKDGEVVLARTGASVGKSYLYNSADGKLVYAGFLIKITPNGQKLISSYLKAWLNTKAYWKWVAVMSMRSGQPGINGNEYGSMPIVLPPTLTEQRLIATVLSDTDALISSLEKLIAKKKAIKQGTMQQLLTGKKRLPEFSGEWEVKKFKDYCWFQEGPGLRNWQFTTKGIKVINVTNLVDGNLNLDRTIRHISLAEFNKMYQHFEIDDKDIVVASSGNSYAKVAVVRKQDLPLVMNTSVIRFKPLYNLDYLFLLAFLKSNLFKDQIDLLITGGAQPNFGPFHLKKLEIRLPPSKEEQSCISMIIYEMDSEIRTLIEKQNKYKSIKQGMMQELLTGKTRLV